MVKHIVLYTLKEGVDKTEAVKLIASVLEPLVGRIPGLLHLEVVAGTEGRHVYYGKTLMGDHVAVLIRDKVATAGFLQVELKCGGDETFVKALVAEINAFHL